MLNDAFEIQLIQRDEGYESGSENFHIQTSLSRALRVYHVSTVDEISFNPANFGHYRAACKAVTSQTQLMQPHMLLPDIHQLP